MKNIDGKEVPLSKFKGKVLLVVNVASKCGNTPQYDALEKVYEQNKKSTRTEHLKGYDFKLKKCMQDI